MHPERHSPERKRKGGRFSHALIFSRSKPWICGGLSRVEEGAEEAKRKEEEEKKKNVRRKEDDKAGEFVGVRP